MTRLLGILLLMWVRLAPAQIVVLEGKITDASTGEPVSYVSIGLKGTTLGTSSNMDGLFTIKAKADLLEKYPLKFSSVGYESVELLNPQGFVDLKMQPSRTILKELIVMNKRLTGSEILRRALKRVPRNYYNKPFIYQTFYRHYCRDDSVYGRLIEAAVDIYKRKGHRLIQPTPGFKEEVSVTQLRRSFDNTRVKVIHVPMALYSVMGIDPVSYQLRTPTDPIFKFYNPHDVSSLRKNLKAYDIEITGITKYDGEDVFILDYKLRNDSMILVGGAKASLKNKQTGRFYITTKDYAIVKTEGERKSFFDTLRTTSIYKKINGKYFLTQSIKDGYNFNRKDKFRHNYHIELTTTNILTDKFIPFKGKEPDRAKLLEINYDSTFWESYNILKSTPLQEQIVSHLEKEQNLKGQYKDFLEAERMRVYNGVEEELEFNKYLKVLQNNRPVYIDFWASWCAPCIEEMKHSRNLVEKYGGKLGFIYLSLDRDAESWKKAIDKYKLQSPYVKHFRIGPSSDAQILFNVDAIPRYILVDRKGNFVELDAKRPSNPDLVKDIDSLLKDNP